MDSPYASQGPSAQQTLDIFKGKWASMAPPTLGNVKAGEAALFADPRLDWAKTKLAELGLPLEASTVLELGPLEGAHTYGLIQRGAKSVTAVEAHAEAYLKCLVMKELLGIERSNFLYGDAVAFLRSIGHTYDIGFVCGFLYHMSDPVGLIELLSKRCRGLFLWTVHWDPAFSAAHPGAPAGNGPTSQRTVGGYTHTLHRHDYGSGLNYHTFWGGPEQHANWMERDEILGALTHFGFTRQVVETQANPNGSALMVAACKD
jgi:Protein of unknown function (DUF1698)